MVWPCYSRLRAVGLILLRLTPTKGNLARRRGNYSMDGWNGRPGHIGQNQGRKLDVACTLSDRSRLVVCPPRKRAAPLRGPCAAAGLALSKPTRLEQQ